MKILYVLQQSIFGNDNKWKSAESNINMMIGFFKALKETSKWKDLEIDIVIAAIKDFSDIKSYNELFKDKNVKYIPYNFPIDAFLNRQHFDVYFWENILQNNYDIIINNIAEQSRNIKTLIEVLNKKAKLVTQCFWMDCPEINEAKVPVSYSYDWRIFDGYECSDLCVFTCESTLKAFSANSFKKFNKKYIKKILARSTIWDFGFSQIEANKYKIQKNKNKKKLILFLNRLSMINYTHHQEFIEAINNIVRYRNDFEVIFTNPSEKFSNKWLKENCSNVKLLNHSLNRKEYWELLYKADISVHLFTKERYGGCSNVESIHCDNIVIMPNIFEYSKRGGKNYPFYIDSNINAENIAQVLNAALDYKEPYSNEKMKERNLNSSFEAQSEQILNELYKLLK
jgi:hypothetical protein